MLKRLIWLWRWLGVMVVNQFFGLIPFLIPDEFINALYLLLILLDLVHDLLCLFFHGFKDGVLVFVAFLEKPELILERFGRN